jgi:diazepam-binding inhibitor (GABA receptor modulator, acyl-CoA-binding protein)
MLNPLGVFIMGEDLDIQFQQAKDDVTQLSQAPDNETMLKLYALYKQGTKGDAEGDRPGMMDFVGRAKFDAWNALAGTSQEKAKADYVAMVEALKTADKKA